MTLKHARPHWNYRVVRTATPEGTLLGIHEVYYRGEEVGWTAEPVAPVDESLAGLRDVLDRMLIALELDVLDGDGTPQ